MSIDVDAIRKLGRNSAEFRGNIRVCSRCGAVLPRDHAGSLCPLFCINRVLGRGKRELALELLELKAGFRMLPPAIAPFTRLSLASTLAECVGEAWLDLIDDELGARLPTDLRMLCAGYEPRRAPAPIVLRCSECHRWNYHLATCSRRSR